MTDIKPGDVFYTSDGRMSFVFFERPGYITFAHHEGPLEKNIYYPDPHLALILGDGYGMLVQTVDGSPVDIDAVEVLAGKGKESEQKVAAKREELQDEFLREAFREGN